MAFVCIEAKPLPKLQTTKPGAMDLINPAPIVHERKETHRKAVCFSGVLLNQDAFWLQSLRCRSSFPCVYGQTTRKSGDESDREPIDAVEVFEVSAGTLLICGFVQRWVLTVKACAVHSTCAT